MPDRIDIEFDIVNESKKAAREFSTQIIVGLSDNDCPRHGRDDLRKPRDRFLAGPVPLDRIHFVLVVLTLGRYAIGRVRTGLESTVRDT